MGSKSQQQAPPPVTAPSGNNDMMMLMSMMQMMQAGQYSPPPAPSVPDMPQVSQKALETAPSGTDWSKTISDLESQVRADFQREKSKKIGISETIHTSSLLDEIDPDTTKAELGA